MGSRPCFFMREFQAHCILPSPECLPLYLARGRAQVRDSSAVRTASAGGDAMTHWFATSFAMTILATIGTLAVAGVILVFLSFSRWTARVARTFQGIVAPFLGVTTVVLGILVGFLANDIWDRDRRAAAAVENEASGLVTLYTLMSTFDRPVDQMAAAIRVYAQAVATQEWPAMVDGESAPQAEQRLDELLRMVARSAEAPGSNPVLARTLIETALTVRASRNIRLTLSRDETAPLKWLAVLVLAVLGEVSIAVVHLERPRPQILALTIFSAGFALVIGLLAAHEVPFTPPFAISPVPITEVLDLVPAAVVPAQ